MIETSFGCEEVPAFTDFFLAFAGKGARIEEGAAKFWLLNAISEAKAGLPAGLFPAGASACANAKPEKMKVASRARILEHHSRLRISRHIVSIALRERAVFFVVVVFHAQVHGTPFANPERNTKICDRSAG